MEAGLIFIFIDQRILNEARVQSYIQAILGHEKIIFTRKKIFKYVILMIKNELRDKIFDYRGTLSFIFPIFFPPQSVCSKQAKVSAKGRSGGGGGGGGGVDTAQYRNIFHGPSLDTPALSLWLSLTLTLPIRGFPKPVQKERLSFALEILPLMKTMTCPQQSIAAA